MLKKKKFKIIEQILKSDTEAKAKKECDISEVLETFGKYQVIQYLLICLSPLCISMISINYVFVAGDINYRCRVDECETVNSTAKFPNWWPDSHIDRCSKPVLKTGEEVCINSSFTSATVPCNNWIYESNDTVVAEFNLACKPWHSNLIGIIHGLGMLVSMIGFGWISDTFGRKPTVIVCIVVGCIGQIKTLLTSYNTYLIIEFIEGAFTGGSYSATLILLLEITSKKYRAWAGVLFSYAFHFGECLFAFISYLEPNWKTIIHIINAPSIFFIVYIFIINESPRWQIVKGEVKKAKKIFKKIIKINGLSINEDELENIDDAELKEKFNLGSQTPKEGFASIFKSKEIMKRAIIMFICRFAVRLIYSGMMLNSVWLPGDKHLNFFLTVVVSFPGETIALYLTYKVGRRGPLIAGFSICGILCIVSAFTPRIYLWLKLTIFFISKLVLSLCFSGIVTYSMELFPTNVRGTLLGFGSFGSRSAIMIAAITPILNTVFEGLPLILFGSMGIISSFLIVCTPETKNSPLFDTIDQVETYLVNSKTKNVSTIEGQMESSVNDS